MSIKKGTVNFNNPISINEAFKLILINGEKKTYYIQGEPGIGKSTLHTMLRAALGDDEWDHIYWDFSLADYGELALRAPDRTTGELELYITSQLKRQSGKKKCIMIDELDKADKTLQKLATRLMLDKVIGDYQFEGIVFATGNMATDGVGSPILAHASNRVTTMNMRKATHTEWLAWATEMNIAPEIRAFVAMTPSVMGSYLDGATPEDNPHVFFPNERNKQFCSPRSLAKCDPDVKNRDRLGPYLTKAALAGTIGMASAELMSAVLSLKDEIITTEQVIADPTAVPVPEKTAALYLMMFNAVDTIRTQDDLNSFMKFMNRVPSAEIQSVFFTMAMSNKHLAPLATKNAEITKWLTAGNYKLLA